LCFSVGILMPMFFSSRTATSVLCIDYISLYIYCMRCFSLFTVYWTGWQHSTPIHDIWFYRVPSRDIARGKFILSCYMVLMLWYLSLDLLYFHMYPVYFTDVWHVALKNINDQDKFFKISIYIYIGERERERERESVCFSFPSLPKRCRCLGTVLMAGSWCRPYAV
jgi:hypothetical protein